MFTLLKCAEIAAEAYLKHEMSNARFGGSIALDPWAMTLLEMQGPDSPLPWCSRNSGSADNPWCSIEVRGSNNRIPYSFRLLRRDISDFLTALFSGEHDELKLLDEHTVKQLAYFVGLDVRREPFPTTKLFLDLHTTNEVVRSLMRRYEQ